jgi:hypothetical protein
VRKWIYYMYVRIHYFINGQMSKHAERPREPTDCRLGEVHMPLQGQALKTVARPQADEHPLETCDYTDNFWLKLQISSLSQHAAEACSPSTTNGCTELCALGAADLVQSVGWPR